MTTNQAKERFHALDIFRGMTICFMIIVNTPGSGATPFAPLLHAHWHGFTPTDLVFPSFLFAVGNAMSFSMQKFRDQPDGKVLAKIFKRALIIFVIGYLMYWFPFYKVNHQGQAYFAPIGETRILGVLQRIALCYLFASLLIRYCSRQVVITASIFFLLAYWVLLLIFGDPSDPLSMTGNAGLYLDKVLFGDPHLYHGEGIPFDPEGLLSTMPAIVNVIVGYYAGRFIQSKGQGYETLSKLLLTGSLFIFIALCWNMVFPVNKKLWSSSFVLLTTGIDMIILPALIYITAIRYPGRHRWTDFFSVFGKNPLAIYVFSEILVVIFYLIHTDKHTTLYKYVNEVFFQQVLPGAPGSLFFAISFMLVCWCAGWFLNRKKIYIRV